VVLVSSSQQLLDEVNIELEKQIELLPRKEIAKKALSHAIRVLVKNDSEAIETINEYAPEHLILMVKDENKYLENIINAGSIFIGSYTPESAGDYASGTNHTLPTSGYAKQYSGVSLDSFIKYITYQKISKEGLQKLGPAIEIMAENEELIAHKNAVSIRLKTLE
jgi:histidinol dehydrogenase